MCLLRLLFHVTEQTQFPALWFFLPMCSWSQPAAPRELSQFGKKAGESPGKQDKRKWSKEQGRAGDSQLPRVHRGLAVDFADSPNTWVCLIKLLLTTRHSPFGGVGKIRVGLRKQWWLRACSGNGVGRLSVKPQISNAAFENFQPQ